MIEAVFPAQAGMYMKMLRLLVAQLDGVEYAFMPIRSPDDACPTQWLKEYWLEILERAHASSAIAIMRGIRWVDAVEAAAATSNFLGFAAALRGFLEHTGDAHESL